MRKEWIFPGTAVLLGAAGFGLRRWERATAFEPETGLVTPGMPSTMALLALCAAAAALCALLGYSQRRGWQEDYDEAFQVEDCFPYLMGMILSAFLLLAGTVLEMIDILRVLVDYQAARAAAGPLEGVPNPLPGLFLPALRAGLAMAAAFCIAAVGRRRYRGEQVGKYSGLLLTPAYFCCVWLISAYQPRTADPVVEDYIYELLAIICALLACYYLAGFSFERPKVGRTVFCCLLAICLSMTTLADGHSWAYVAFYAFAICYSALSAVFLLRGASASSWPKVFRRETWQRKKEEQEREDNPNEAS